jgi:methyl-accepting chemotaxis protein
MSLDVAPHAGANEAPVTWPVPGGDEEGLLSEEALAARRPRGERWMHPFLSLVFRPATRIMDRLKYAEKFLLIGILFVAPLATVLYLYITNAGIQVDFAAAELSGTQYLRPLTTLSGDIVRLRGLGEGGNAQAREALQKRIAADLDAVKSVEKELGTDLKTGKEFAAVAKDVGKLTSGQPKDDAFVAALTSIGALIAQVGDGSNLILDPDLDSYYLMDMVVVEFSSTLQTTSQIGALAQEITKHGGEPTADEKAQLIVLAGLARDRLSAIERGMTVASANTNDPTLQPTIEAPIRKLLDTARKFLTAIEAGNVAAAGTADPSLQTSEALLTVQNVATDALDKLMTTRMDGFNSKTHRVEIFTLIALTVVLYLLVGFYRSVMTTSRRVATAAHQLAEEDLPSLVACLGALATGDLTRRARVTATVIETSSRDELGGVAVDVNRVITRLSELSIAFSEMSENLRDMVGQVQTSAIGLADTSEELGVTTYQTGEAVRQVAKAIQDVAAGAYDTSRHALTTTAAVTQLGQFVDGIAHGAQAQELQVQQATATAAEMVSRVEQVAGSAQSMAAASQQTRASAEHGADAVRETMASMAEIQVVVTEAAQKVAELGGLGERIGAVVETIDEIAEQTNLLALNAAIEAARAGSHGVGFAVVADEVRKLAERSGRETRQIGALIQQVQAGTNDVVGAMAAGSEKVAEGTARADQAGRALDEIRRAVEETVSRVTEIAASAQEMAAGARAVTASMSGISTVAQENSQATSEMSSQTGQVTDSVQGIAAVSEQQSAAAEQVSASAEEMSAQVDAMSKQADDLSVTAEQLKALVACFRLESDEEPEAAPEPVGRPKRRRPAGYTRRAS